MAKTSGAVSFLVGAGASIDSGLPSGGDMVRTVFDLLVNSGRVALDRRTVKNLRAFVVEQLRLEIFLEILTGEISPATIFRPFESFLTSSPNFHHLAIMALSSRRVATTNQDLLLEDAAYRLGLPRGVVHLHGKSDDLRSIITIVSQYLGGLAPRVRRAFRSEIAGQTITVIGYSGRDRDVMQALLDAKPRKVTWLLHDRSPVYPEVEHAKDVLGTRFELISVNTKMWLSDRLGPKALKQVEAADAAVPRVHPCMPGDVYDAFASIPSLQRNRAVARVLEHLGQYDKAKQVYQQIRPATAAARARRLLDLARVEARVGGQNAGRAKFFNLKNRRDLPVGIRGRVLLNAADTLRNTSHAADANRELEQLDKLLRVKKDELTYKEFWHFRGWSLIARAGTSRLEGRPSTAARYYRRAERAFLRARDVDGHIAVLTWGAETQLMMGNFASAWNSTEDAVREAGAYSKWVLSGWPLYVRAECLVQRGRQDEALTVLEDAVDVLNRYGNIQGTLWSLLLRADCLRVRSLGKAERLCGEIRSRVSGRQLAHIESRLCLTEAEIARQRGNVDAVAAALSNVREQLHNTGNFTKAPALPLAHAALVEAEMARQLGESGSIRLLRSARDAYAQIGAQAFVARVSVAIALTRPAVSTPVLLRHCLERSYELEVRRLTGVDTGFYPIHFV